MTASSTHYQSDYNLRFEWGRRGLEALAPHVDVVVLVDVLSFSTTVEMALGQGAEIVPCLFRDEEARALADRLSARLAVRRAETNEAHPFSLSPGSMLHAQPGERIVLPSPNGSALTVAASEYCDIVLTGCLRNAHAVAIEAARLGQRIAVIAAGEHWKGDHGGLRVAFEDLIGAGAILGAISERMPSPEALAAIAAYAVACRILPRALRECSSGRELIAMGFAEDISLAAENDVSEVVPRLTDGVYRRM